MEIHYQLTEEDYINFNLFHAKNSKTVIKTLNLQRFIVPVFVIILSFFLSNIVDTSFLRTFIPPLIVSILWLFFYPKYFYYHIIRATKKLIKEGKNNGLLGKHTLIITEEGINDFTPYNETKESWLGIKIFKEDNEYFYLYNSSISAYILPKREINNVEEIRNYLKLKIPHK